MGPQTREQQACELNGGYDHQHDEQVVQRPVRCLRKQHSQCCACRGDSPSHAATFPPQSIIAQGYRPLAGATLAASFRRLA
jgi:hypothetical protein